MTDAQPIPSPTEPLSEQVRPPCDRGPVMSAYATAVSEMSREDLIAELFRHKDAKDAAREEGRESGLREAAEIVRELYWNEDGQVYASDAIEAIESAARSK